MLIESLVGGWCMRLKFVEPLMPTLVEKPPEGDAWIHEVKFDGYRSQIVIDEEGTHIRGEEDLPHASLQDFREET